jgi:structural maintenance of chromosome 3 (chondroitin sulfate proteoglycan 6)
LIATLDRKKEEAIDRTIRTVGMNFEAVFAELVPNGRGEIILENVNFIFFLLICKFTKK